MDNVKDIFGTDGIRGPVGPGGINTDLVLKVGLAFGKMLGERYSHPGVLVGKDTRVSSDALEASLIAGLLSAGVDVSCAGILPTPGIAYLTKSMHFSAGIIVSASHNHFSDNGLKFFDDSGNKLSEIFEKKVIKHLGSSSNLATKGIYGKQTSLTDATGRYVEFCKASSPDGFSLSGMKIILDAANGAAFKSLGLVFSELGANIIEIASCPNGININDGVGCVHPTNLSEAVLQHTADLGLSLDGDGDRLIISDRYGRIFNGDELLYVIAKSKVQKKGVGEIRGVVGTLMSNLGLEKAIISIGLEFRRSKVGDRYIAELLRETGWRIGGESSGHIIYLDAHSTGDGIISAIQVLSAILDSGIELDGLLQDFEKIPQVLINVPIARSNNWRDNSTFLAAQQMVANELGDNGRLLVRPSGTEPLLRIMVEAQTEIDAKEKADFLAKTLD